MTVLDNPFVDRAIERAVSECGHVVIDGRCYRMLTATMDQTTVESNDQQSLHEWLTSQEFDLQGEIQRDRDVFKGVFTFSQLCPVDCGVERHETGSIEGMRRWMKAGCPG